MAIGSSFKVFERYLAREIYLSTLLVLGAFLALFSFFDLVHELSDLGKGGYQFRHALGYVLLTLPGRAYELFPVAVLIGSLYAVTQLARHSEITVLRASGLSTGRLLWAFGKIGIAFVVMTFLIGEFLAPPSERLAQQLRLRATSDVVGQEFRSGLWVRDEHAFVNVREVLPDTTLRGVRIYEFDGSHQLLAISEAESGTHLAAERWQLGNVVRTIFKGDRIYIEHVDEFEWRSALTPDILTVLMVAPARMTIVNLYLYINHLSENQQKTQRYEIALWKKLIYPAAALVMMALALPFGYLHDRMGNVSVKIFLGIMLGITFHLLNGLFSSLGIINAWPPAVAALTPSVLYLLAAAVMTWWVERR
jgi:lipopolysaccharide export system permease protein